MEIQFLYDISALPATCVAHGHIDHNCQKCVYWLMQGKDFTTTSFSKKNLLKSQYISKAAESSYGYIIAKENDEIVGLLQCGPVSEYKRNLDYGSDLTKKDRWRIVCLQAKRGDEKIKKALLLFAIAHVKEHHREIREIIASPIKTMVSGVICSVGDSTVFYKTGFTTLQELAEGYIMVLYSLS